MADHDVAVDLGVLFGLDHAAGAACQRERPGLAVLGERVDRVGQLLNQEAITRADQHQIRSRAADGGTALSKDPRIRVGIHLGAAVSEHHADLAGMWLEAHAFKAVVEPGFIGVPAVERMHPQLLAVLLQLLQQFRKAHAATPVLGTVVQVFDVQQCQHLVALKAVQVRRLLEQGVERVVRRWGAVSHSCSHRRAGAWPRCGSWAVAAFDGCFVGENVDGHDGHSDGRCGNGHVGEVTAVPTDERGTTVAESG